MGRKEEGGKEENEERKRGVGEGGCREGGGERGRARKGGRKKGGKEKVKREKSRKGKREREMEGLEGERELRKFSFLSGGVSRPLFYTCVHAYVARPLFYTCVHTYASTHFSSFAFLFSFFEKGHFLTLIHEKTEQNYSFCMDFLVTAKACGY